MGLSRIVVFVLAVPIVWAQSVVNPRAIPHTSQPPIVFLNGFETDCPGATFQRAFGIADQVLLANGRNTLFFNNCSISGSPSIERLGAAFGTFLSGLSYDDGLPVETVDAVGYSMGGLILRSYLIGKAEADGTFAPPVPLRIRRAVFVATPHFGTPVGNLAFGVSTQIGELSSASHFLFDLNTWNQNRDDLRGVDAIAMAGTGGTGLATLRPGFDDGLVPLSSASLEFYGTGRTRVLPLCHVASPGVLTQIGFCPSGAKGIAKVLSADDENARIMVSFLNGTAEWQSIGTDIRQNSFVQNAGGITVRARTAADGTLQPSSMAVTPASGSSQKLTMPNSEIGYTDLIAAGDATLSVSAGAQSFSEPIRIPAGGARAIVAKSGPLVDAIIPAAAVVFPLVVAPRMIVAIYGSGMDQATVTLNGKAVSVLYGSAGQINAVLPVGAGDGLSRLTVQNVAGSHTVNVWVEPGFPAVFTLTQTGVGPAAAINVSNGGVVSSANRLHAGDYVALFLTGLGATENRGGFDYAVVQPTVTVGGVDCPVSYAGAAPGFTGLDQINCRIPGGLGRQDSAAVLVRSGVRFSSGATLAVE